MPGTKIGGQKAAATNKAKYGSDFYKNIGKKGGHNSRTGGFASNKVGEDGKTGRERAKIAGAKGGSISRRGPAKPKANKPLYETVHKKPSVAVPPKESERLLKAITELEKEEDQKTVKKESFFKRLFGGKK